MNVDDFLRLLRGKRADYVGSTRESTVATLSAGVAADAVSLGAEHVEIDAGPVPWVIVSSDCNWIVRGLSEPMTIATIFQSPLLLSEPRSSRHNRHEMFVFAYASAIFVRDGQHIEVVSGDPPPTEVSMRGRAFAVGFRID